MTDDEIFQLDDDDPFNLYLVDKWVRQGKTVRFIHRGEDWGPVTKIAKARAIRHSGLAQVVTPANGYYSLQTVEQLDFPWGRSTTITRGETQSAIKVKKAADGQSFTLELV